MFYIKELHLEGYRNYLSLYLEFGPGLNIIVGDNAQGKTNLLESIYLLSVNRSFRTYRDKELINFDRDFFRVKGIFINNEIEDTVGVTLQCDEQLRVKFNSQKVKRYSQLQEHPVIIFCPDDVGLINEGPMVRRKFLNLMISRLSTAYFHLLKDYQKILKQRNSILRKACSVQEAIKLLDPWNSSLVKCGSAIIAERLEVIDKLEKEANHYFSILTSSLETLSLKYHCKLTLGAIDLIEKSYLKSLENDLPLELRRGFTATGPHVDDFSISINQKEARKYASQGQKRTAALSLKLGEIALIKSSYQKAPILLLDDVFSEFDHKRQQALLGYLVNNSNQCLISSATNMNSDFCNLNKDLKSFIVQRGIVYEEHR